MLLVAMNKQFEKPLTLSLVIPVYNEENYLKRTLEAIRDQVVQADEVIVVDNNSTDKSVEIAKKYPFVRIVTEKRAGIAYARDAGFNAATCDLIGRIDADTRLPKNWVKDVKEAFENNPEMAFTGSGYFYDMPAKNLLRYVHIYYYFYLNRLICGQYLLWGSNMAFPRKYWPLVKDSVSYDEAVAEDMDLSFLLNRHVKIKFIVRITTSNSFRGGKNGIIAAWKYVRRWPESLKHYKASSAFMAWVIIISMLLVFWPLVLITGLVGKLAGRSTTK